MDTNSLSERWHEFCFLLSDNISATATEKEFENQVVRAIEVLGWREFKGEIERQPTVKMGRQGILRPDLIIYNQKHKALIVIEVKRPVQNITGDDSIGQLMSYMRQMKSDFGLLIGTDLRVYYDGSLNPQSDPLLLEKIPFDKNSSSGESFVENFNRDSFLENEYKQYLEGKIKKFSQKKEIEKLIETLVSEETKQEINRFLEKLYPDFGPETYSAAMKEVSIDIKRIQNPLVPPDKMVKPVKEKGRMKNTKRRYGISIGNLISSSLLKPGEILIMTYGPRGGTKETFEATINSDGSLSVQGKKLSSPSAAAEYCMSLSGTRRTADGWIHWKNKAGHSLADLRKRG
jgi:hypothetical protein